MVLTTMFTVPLNLCRCTYYLLHMEQMMLQMQLDHLAAINDAVMTGGISAKAGIPLWVMAVGAIRYCYWS